MTRKQIREHKQGNQVRKKMLLELNHIGFDLKGKPVGTALGRRYTPIQNGKYT